MDMQTGSNEEIYQANYMVAALQRQVLTRSNITAFIVNKQVMGTRNDETFTGNKFNRIAGLEYNHSTPDNRWNGKAYYHQNLLDNTTFKDAAMAVNLTYSSQYMTASLNQSFTGSGYNAET